MFLRVSFFSLAQICLFIQEAFFDFWSVLSFRMSFSRLDASFLLKFEDVSGARLNNSQITEHLLPGKAVLMGCYCMPRVCIICKTILPSGKLT